MGSELPEDVRTAVKATVPVLEKQGYDVVKRFYNIMFEKYPTVRAYFSDGAFKDSKGPPPQVQRLGAAVTAFAKNIDDPSVLLGTIRKISHVHASRNVRAPHYPIVGKCLLEAMEEVLGYNGTEWKLAYEWLADICIAVDNEVRATAKNQAGFDRFQKCTVDQFKKEDYGKATTLVLKPVESKVQENKDAGGKFVCVQFSTPDVKYKSKITAYLSDVGTSDHLRVTVPSDAVKMMDYTEVVRISPIYGIFDANDVSKAKRIALISSGIDIARMFAIMKSIVFQKEGNDSGKDSKIVFVIVPSKDEENDIFLFAKEIKAFELQHDNVKVSLLESEKKESLKDQLTKSFMSEPDAKDESTQIVLTPTLKSYSETLKDQYNVSFLD